VAPAMLTAGEVIDLTSEHGVTRPIEVLELMDDLVGALERFSESVPCEEGEELVLVYRARDPPHESLCMELDEGADGWEVQGFVRGRKVRVEVVLRATGRSNRMPRLPSHAPAPRTLSSSIPS
jgi:hypothetical protein